MMKLPLRWCGSLAGLHSCARASADLPVLCRVQSQLKTLQIVNELFNGSKETIGGCSTALGPPDGSEAVDDDLRRFVEL